MQMTKHRCLVCFLILLCLVVFATAKCLPESCGKMNLSFPFWIHKRNCGYPGFQIECLKEENSGEWAPFLPAYVGENNDGATYKTRFKIVKINYTGYVEIDSSSIKAESCIPGQDVTRLFQLPPNGPFTISMSNRFVVIGCYIFGTYAYGDWGDVRCVSGCVSQTDPPYCSDGCCEIVLRDNWKWINFTGGTLRSSDNFTYNNNYTDTFDKRCGFSTIFDPSTFKHKDNISDYLQNCSTVKSTTNYSCSSDAECIDSPTWKGHVCKCRPGYQGNGYSNGTSCADVNECSSRELNNCTERSKGGRCHNLPGSYKCSCANGYKKDGTQCASNLKTIISATIGSVTSFVGVSLGASVLFWWLRRRQLNHMRDKYFRQNGGMQLQERIAVMGGKRTLTIFSEKELEIASNNYSVELGRGGFATVYKGVLLDKLQVAIKKPKAISDEFINEITIFSHINHKNIVKVFGCCLETQYPLLVYEFVSNGTLFKHLQNDQEKHLPWEMRLRIAIEVADAIAYMHFQVSPQILHHDTKSSNILLDDTLIPKVSDFGISRLRPSDATHLSTMAVGTRGYLDPEFFISNQYIDKSDIFSFGVVLLELLTGQRPLLSLNGTMSTLYDHFFLRMNQNALTEILDPNVVNDKNQGQMENMARLVEACLRIKSKARLSMKEVVEKLSLIIVATNQSEPHKDVSLVDKKKDWAQENLTGYNFAVSGASTSEDHYHWSIPGEIALLEDPSTAMIQVQMSNMDGR